MRTVRYLAIPILMLGLSPSLAFGYGIVTHAWLAQEAAHQLAATDPAFGFLETDPEARACFMYGAFFPDFRSVAARAGVLEDLKQRLEGQAFVKGVRYSTDDAEASLASFNSHNGAFVLHLVDVARQQSDPYFLAFALGNLAHTLQDKFAQVIHLGWRAQESPCGDLAVCAAEDPAELPYWHPGKENELYFEGYADTHRPLAIHEFVRDAPWRLAATPDASYQRALELRRRYFQAAHAFVVQQGGTPPTEQGILNGARLFEVTATLGPFLAAHESLADGVRHLTDRYVELEWWASALTGLVQLVTQQITNGQDLFDVLGPLVPLDLLGNGAGDRSCLVEILFAHAQGGSERQRVDAKYANNVEYQRLVRPGGYLDDSTYAPEDYQLAHHFVVHGLVHGRASHYTDDRQWPGYAPGVARSTAVRSLLRLSGHPNVANAPQLMLFALRFEDPTSGARLQELRLPADTGRQLRTVVEVCGTDDEPVARLLRLRLRADTGAGPNDPVLAERSRLIPASQLDVTRYGDEDRPTIEVEWTVQDVPNAQGCYIELWEVRPFPVAADGEADLLFTGELSSLAPLTQGRVHYDQSYGTYAGRASSLPIRR